MLTIYDIFDICKKHDIRLQICYLDYLDAYALYFKRKFMDEDFNTMKLVSTDELAASDFGTLTDIVDRSIKELSDAECARKLKEKVSACFGWAIMTLIL